MISEFWLLMLLFTLKGHRYLDNNKIDQRFREKQHLSIDFGLSVDVVQFCLNYRLWCFEAIKVASNFTTVLIFSDFTCSVLGKMAERLKRVSPIATFYNSLHVLDWQQANYKINFFQKDNL